MKTGKKPSAKMGWNFIVFIGLIIFTFWFLLRTQDVHKLINVINEANKVYILLAIILMFFVYLMESINIRSVLISLGEKKFPIVRAFKYTAIGSFFSAITPAATGGQPVEIYYMAKDGIKTSNATLTMLVQLCGFQISAITLSIICAFINPGLFEDGMLLGLYLLGLVINGGALLITLLVMFSNKTASKIIDFVLRFLKLIKVKNYEGKNQKMKEGLEKYSNSAKYIRSHPKEFFAAIVRVFIQVVFYHSISYFIYRSFGLSGVDMLQIFTIQAILYIAASGIPLPGTVGVSETLFLKLFLPVFGSSLVNGAMVLYRFVSFYLYVALFLIVVITAMLKNRNKKV